LLRLAFRSGALAVLGSGERLIPQLDRVGIEGGKDLVDLLRGVALLGEDLVETVVRDVPVSFAFLDDLPELVLHLHPDTFRFSELSCPTRGERGRRPPRVHLELNYPFLSSRKAS